MRKLIEKGADVNAVNEENNTVLILVVKAAKRGFGQVFENGKVNNILFRLIKTGDLDMLCKCVEVKSNKKEISMSKT